MCMERLYTSRRKTMYENYVKKICIEVSTLHREYMNEQCSHTYKKNEERISGLRIRGSEDMPL